MKVAVTGGTGFLGRYILPRLADQGRRLRAWKRATSDLTGLEALPVEWVEGDLRATPDELLEGVDAVVHAALERPGNASFRDSGSFDLVEFVETNLVGTLRLMEAARQRNIGRFIFISTCAVHEVILDDRPLDETHPVWPTTHYGAHKAALEAFVSSYGRGQGWTICSLRPSGIYGVAHPPSKSKYYDLVGDVLAGKPIESPRGGKEVHAADVAKAVDILLSADEDAIRGQAFNCCEGYIAEQRVAQIAKELSGSSSSIADLNEGPKHQIENAKLRALGMEFGGESLLRDTVSKLIEAHRSAGGESKSG